MLLYVLIFAINADFSVKTKKYGSISKILIDPYYWLPLSDSGEATHLAKHLLFVAVYVV